MLLPGRKLSVPPSGPRDASIAIVGEQPGKTELQLRKPFVGPAGRELDKCLQVAGITRGECYITNVIKDLSSPLKSFVDLTPKGPIISELGREYINLLKEELTQVNPKVIIATGNIPLLALTNRTGITKWRGSVIESTLIPNLKVLPTLHPATVIPPKNVYLNRHLITLDLKRAKEESLFHEILELQRSLKISPSFSDSIQFLEKCIEVGKRGEIIWFDIEVVNEELSCISFAYSEFDAISIPFTEHQGDFYSLEQEKDIFLKMAQLLEDPEIQKGGQNLSFDTTYLYRKLNLLVRGELHDTMIAQKISLPDYSAGLDFITTLHTDIPYYKAEGKKWMKVGGAYKEFWLYNAKDSIACAAAFPSQANELSIQENLPTYNRQRSLIHPLVYMSSKGIYCDIPGMEKKREETKERIKELEEELWTLCEEQVNYNSPKQVGSYFYDKKGVPAFKSKSGGRATDVKALKRLAKGTSTRKGFKEAKLIMELRTLSTKWLGTYLDLSKIEKDGRYHSSYNPVGTVTGRLSSSETIFGTGGNQQNWPHELLRYLTADPGYILYSFDLAQAENRIVAYVGRVHEMIKAFEEGVDLHSLTAALVFEKPVSEISREPGSSNLGDGTHSERDWGKRANHSLNYDIGYVELGLIYEITEKEAKWLIQRYHQAYPGVRENYHNLIKNQLAKSRTVTNLFGRKRMFLNEWGRRLFKDAYAQIPQSTVADKINEHGLLPLYYDQNLTKDTELLTQIHDSIVFQMPLSIPFSRHAEVLMQVKELLETPLEWHGREFVIPADLTISRNLSKLDGKELGHKKFPKTKEHLTTTLEQIWSTLETEDERQNPS